MRFSNFTGLNEEIDKLIELNKYTEALDLLETGVNELPSDEAEKNKFWISWLFAKLYGLTNKYEECLDVIRIIVHEGYPFPMSFKRFEPLRNVKGYKEVNDINNELLNKANAAASIKYEVHLPKDYDSNKKYPLFLALHGHGICNIKEFISSGWKPDVFIGRGFIFAYLQSSQVLCYEGYGWMDDLDKANKDIKQCIDSIASEYPADLSSIYIGGYSGGAIASVNFSLSDVIPVKGVVALCPEIMPSAFTDENVRKAAQKGLKCVFMEGEKVLPVFDEDEMMGTFDEQGLPYEYYINTGAGHDIPSDFDEKLEQAITFISGRQAC